MAFATAQYPVVGDSILAAIVHGAAIGNVCLIILEPIGHGALVVSHHARHHGHVTAVVDRMMPIPFQVHGRLFVFGIYHQTAGIPVEAMHHMGSDMLAALLEMVVQHALDVERGMTRLHAEDAHVLFHHHKIRIFINYSYVAVAQFVVTLALGDADRHARLERSVKLGHHLAVNQHAPSLQGSLHLGTALSFYVLHEPLQQRSFPFYFVDNISFLPLTISCFPHTRREITKIPRNIPSRQQHFSHDKIGHIRFFTGKSWRIGINFVTSRANF